MTRIIHFGVVHRDDPESFLSRNAHGRLVFVDALRRRLAGSEFVVDGDSHTVWGEQFPQGEHDAIHVSHLTESDYFDPEGERIRLSPDEVREIAADLADWLPTDLRLVDYWLEDDGEEWGSDVHLHGPWAIASIAGRRIAGDSLQEVGRG